MQPRADVQPHTANLQARRALVDHGGDIEVTSSPEEGPEFILRFPDQATLADASRPMSQASATS